MQEQIDRAIRLAGGMTDLGKAVGATVQTVYNWKLRGRIPAEIIPSVCKATDWEVKPHDFRPDLWPGRLDGLPEGKRNEVYRVVFNPCKFPAGRPGA